MIQTLDDFYKHSASGGMFIDSCFAHSQIERQDNWFAADSPTVQKKVLSTHSVKLSWTYCECRTYY